MLGQALVILGSAFDGARLASTRAQRNEVTGKDLQKAIIETKGLRVRGCDAHGLMKAACRIDRPLEADAGSGDLVLG